MVPAGNELDISYADFNPPGSDVTATVGGVLFDVNFHVQPNAPVGDTTIHVVQPPETSPNGRTSSADASNHGAAPYPNLSPATNGVIQIDGAASFTSAGTSTFSVNSADSFTVSAVGLPAATLSESGALPQGVTFNPANGLLSGTPATGTSNNYPVVFIGSNSVGSTSQSFTLTVVGELFINSPSSASFTLGSSSSFTVTTNGGSASVSLSENGALPGGLNFADQGNGTALISGMPTGSPSTDTFSITATDNNTHATKTQDFTLTVDQMPAIMSADSATFAVGALGSVTVTATGSPAPTFSESGALPTGVTFNDTTGLLSGTPATNTDAGLYNLTITAHNGAGNDATQNFALTVDPQPVLLKITSTTANGTYGPGATINVTATFTEPVTLSGGNLLFNLNTGASVSIAPFANMTTVSGTYTVAAGDNAALLDVTSLTLGTGATLTDGSGNNNVSLAIPSDQAAPPIMRASLSAQLRRALFRSARRT